MELGNKEGVHIPIQATPIQATPMQTETTSGVHRPTLQNSGIHVPSGNQTKPMPSETASAPQIRMAPLVYQNTPLSSNKGMVITGGTVSVLVIIVAIAVVIIKNGLNRRRAKKAQELTQKRTNRLNSQIIAKQRKAKNP